jgi:hypothetical protein
MPDDSPALIYETQLVPAIFEPLTRFVIERARPVPGEHVLDAACGTGIVARRSRGWSAAADKPN